MRNIVLAAALTAGLFTTGCGACAELAAEKAAEKIAEKAMGAAGVDIDTKTGEIRIEGKDGTVTIGTKEGSGSEAAIVIKGKDGEARFGDSDKVPDDFPMRVLSGAKIQGSASHKREGQQSWFLTHSARSEVPVVSSFYEKELEAMGLKVERAEIVADGKKLVTLAGKNAEREVSVVVTDLGDEGTATQISVNLKL